MKGRAADCARSRRSRFALIAGSVVALFGLACGDATEPRRPNAMQPSGGGQSVLYGSRLRTPLEVRVFDQHGNPAPGVAVAADCHDTLSAPPRSSR